MARAREVFGALRVVVVSAPQAVLEARILARGRDDDAPGRRARDLTSVADSSPDLIVDNSGSLDAAVERLLAF